MDSLADMGGSQGWGRAKVPTDEPPFAEAWEGRSFALTLLTMGRISGRNLDAFRHALERLHPVDYLVDGYYGRWLNAAELMLTDSAILGVVPFDARTPSHPVALQDDPLGARSEAVRRLRDICPALALKLNGNGLRLYPRVVLACFMASGRTLALRTRPRARAPARRPRSRR